MAPRRTSLWLLLVLFIVYVVALPFVNRIHPIVFGIPFFTFWILVCVVATPVVIWLAARYDPLYGKAPGGEGSEGTDGEE